MMMLQARRPVALVKGCNGVITQTDEAVNNVSIEQAQPVRIARVDTIACCRHDERPPPTPATVGFGKDCIEERIGAISNIDEISDAQGTRHGLYAQVVGGDIQDHTLSPQMVGY